MASHAHIQQPSAQRGSARVAFRVSAVKKPSGWISIRLRTAGAPLATVTNDPESSRYNRILFGNLRRMLIDQGSWPFGPEGEEQSLIDFKPVVLRGKSLTATLLEERGER